MTGEAVIDDKDKELIYTAIDRGLATLYQTGAFTARDAGFGKSLAERVINSSYLSDTQYWYGLKMLQGYQGVLKHHGLVVPPLTVLPAPNKVAKPFVAKQQKEAKPLSVRGSSAVIEKQIVLTIASESDNIAADLILAIPEVTHDEKQNRWIAPISSAEYVLKFLPNFQHDRLLAAIVKKQRLLARIGRSPGLEASIEVLREYGCESHVHFDVNLANDAKLKKFQRAGVYHMVRSDGRVLLCDEMGLGKTIQAIAYMQIEKEKRPVLVVCKSTIKTNWSREIKKFLSDGNQAHIIRGRTPYVLPDADIYIINYEILSDWAGYLSKMAIKIAVADECHMIRNPKSGMNKAFRKITKDVPHVIMSTATPMENGPEDLWAFLSIVAPHAWQSKKTFAERYTKTKNIKVKRKFKRSDGSTYERQITVPKSEGAMNLKELYRRASPYLVRRLMKDVESEIPPKIRSTIVLEMSEVDRKRYDDALQELYDEIDALGEGERPNHFKLMHRTTQLAADAKIAQVVEWVKDFTRSGEKLILYTKNVNILERYLEELPGSFRIDGSTPVDKRQSIIDEFEKSTDRFVLVANIDAAAEGFNANFVDAIVFSQFDYRPTRHDQCEGRGRRIGKTSVLNCVYFVAEDTIEEEIMQILARKLEVIDEALNGEESEHKFTNQDVGREVLAKIIARRRAQKARQKNNEQRVAA